MRLVAAVLAACSALALAVTASADAPAWHTLAHVPGVFDLGGPRSDGKLVVGGAGKLYLMDATGELTPLASGEDNGSEPYFAVSTPLAGRGCSFSSDDLFVLRLHKPVGITRISASGAKSNFASLPLAGLGGIVFDSVGAFGNRLLVTGTTSGGEHELIALDCTGASFVINGALPANEGGFAVAPGTFGAFAGMLIAPDENSGKIWAFGANGTVQLLVDSGLPHGGDVGVESLGFVPPGFLRGGTLYFADRSTPGNPHPGTDSVLTLQAADLASAGVQEGDLLAATEGGGQLIAVRCVEAACQILPVISTATKAHGEGHLVLVTSAPPPSPSPSPSAPPTAPSIRPVASSTPSAAVLAAVVVGAVVIAVGGIIAGLFLGRRRG